MEISATVISKKNINDCLIIHRLMYNILYYQVFFKIYIYIHNINVHPNRFYEQLILYQFLVRLFQ